MDGKLLECIGAQGVYEGQLAKLGRDETTIWWNLKEYENIAAYHSRLIKDTALESAFSQDQNTGASFHEVTIGESV
jgi:hypothetical protein